MCVDEKRPYATGSDAALDLTGWQQKSVVEFEDRINNQLFPCIFARNAVKKNNVTYAFVSGGNELEVNRFADTLHRYTRAVRSWDGKLDTADPMVVLFDPSVVRFDSVAQYHAFGWKFLQDVVSCDTALWPDDIPMTPESPEWSLCFDKTPLFCNMSTPLHSRRRSRNLGSAFTIIINPRERFDIFAGDTPSGRNTRKIIRNRIDSYDAIQHSKLLSNYGQGGLEWQQFALEDHNDTPTERCPLTFESGSTFSHGTAK